MNEGNEIPADTQEETIQPTRRRFISYAPALAGAAGMATMPVMATFSLAADKQERTRDLDRLGANLRTAIKDFDIEGAARLLKEGKDKNMLHGLVLRLDEGPTLRASDMPEHMCDPQVEDRYGIIMAKQFRTAMVMRSESQVNAVLNQAMGQGSLGAMVEELYSRLPTVER